MQLDWDRRVLYRQHGLNFTTYFDTCLHAYLLTCLTRRVMLGQIHCLLGYFIKQVHVRGHGLNYPLMPLAVLGEIEDRYKVLGMP